MFVFCVYAFLTLFFSMNGGSQGYLGVWVKILEFEGMLLICLKVRSEKVCQNRLFITTVRHKTRIIDQ